MNPLHDRRWFKSPKPTPSPEQGRKYDAAKPRLDLVPMTSLLEVGKVLEFGARKYADNNWQQVPGGTQRYYAAALRHLAACQEDFGARDPESGLPHLAHAACCVLFMLWFVISNNAQGRS